MITVITMMIMVHEKEVANLDWFGSELWTTLIAISICFPVTPSHSLISRDSK
jgi:hypothetical protein